MNWDLAKLMQERLAEINKIKKIFKEDIKNMAVDLRDRIHSDFSTGSGVWSDYRRQITGAYIDDKGAGVNYGDYTNHLIREYNDKITDLNQQIQQNNQQKER